MKLRKTVLQWVIAIAFFLLAFLFLPTQARAVEITASGTCGVEGDNLAWTLDSEGTLTISGTGEMESYSSQSSPWFNNQEIKKVVFEYGVTQIGSLVFEQCTQLSAVVIPDSVTVIDGAFEGCTSLTSVTIPESVVYISSRTFNGCSNLTGIWVDKNNSHFTSDSSGVLFSKNMSTLVRAPATLSGKYIIPDSTTNVEIEAFSGCSEITAVTMPDSVTKVGSWSFEGCTKLESVNIPNSLTTISFGTFYGCTSLKSITLPDSLTTIEGSAFNHTGLVSICIPSSLTTLGNFYGCASLSGIWVDENNPNYSSDASGVLFNKDKTTLIQAPSMLEGSYLIPASVVVIENSAFYDCRNLCEVILPEGLTTIYDGAFWDCTNISSVAIPNTVTYIGWFAFRNCIGLEEVSLPNGLTDIANYMFKDCVNLKSVSMPPSLIRVGSCAFEGCRSLESIEIPNCVTLIDFDAFRGCSSLTSISIPQGVTKLGSGVFQSSGLISVELPLEISEISWLAFKDCINLTCITIPNSVTYVGDYAFEGCSALTDVYFKGTRDQKASITIGNYNEPINNATWHYNVVPELKFSGASVVLHNNLAINFKVDSTLFADTGYVSPYVVFDFGGVETTVTNFTEQDGKYVFTFRNIAPNQIGQTVTATLYATLDDQLCQGMPATYSVTDYCYRMLDTYAPDNDPNNQYGELRTLLVDLLHYGAASQTYNGDAGTLVNAQLTAEQLAWGSSGELTLTSVLNREHEKAENPTVAWKGAGLALQDCVVVRIKFAAENTEGLKVKATVGDVTYTISESKFVATDTEGVYYIYFDKLSALQLREAIYFTVYSEGEAVSDTLCYSVESYAQKYHTSDNAALAELIKAVIRYGDAAYAYKN